MTKEELKKLFEKYDIFTLDSLNILINYLDETEKKEIFPAFKSVYTKKYKEVEREFEGINEYDFICKLLNFNIQDIIDSIDTLSKTELHFFNHIIEVAKSKISKHSEENYKLYNSLIMYQEHIEAYENYANYSKNKIDITDTELEEFFKKYNSVELKNFITILDNARYDWNVYNIFMIYKKILNDKNIYNDQETLDNYNEKLEISKISDLRFKNKNLNDKELKFIYTLVDSALSFLNFKNNPDDENLIKDIYCLDKSLYEEMIVRNDYNAEISKKEKSKILLKK